MNLVFYRKDRNELQKDSIPNAKEAIFDQIYYAFEDYGDEIGCGQYVSSELDGQKPGVVGTASAVQICALVEDETDDAERLIEDGQCWLIERWSESDGIPITYKVVPLLNSLLPRSDTVVDDGDRGDEHPLTGEEKPCQKTISGLFDEVWDQRVHRGWGEHENDSSYNRVATSLALLAFSRTERPYTDEYKKTVERLIRKVDRKIVQFFNTDSENPEYYEKRDSKSKRRLCLEAAFCLILMSRLETVYDEAAETDSSISDIPDFGSDPNFWENTGVEEKKNEIAKGLKRLNESRKHDSDPFYIRTYFVEKSDQDEKEHEFRYQPFLTDPIVALAFLRSGYVAENLRYVINTVKYYTGEISEDSLYTPNEEDYPPIGDHVWIAKMLTEYQQYDFNRELGNVEVFWRTLVPPEQLEKGVILKGSAKIAVTLGIIGVAYVANQRTDSVVNDAAPFLTLFAGYAIRDVVYPYAKTAFGLTWNIVSEGVSAIRESLPIRS